MADDMVRVFDHGYVKLIDYMGTDESIIEAARMSTGKGFLGWGQLKECARCKLTFASAQPVSGWECVGTVRADDALNRDPHDWKPKKGDEHLLEFLYRNEHMSPFEMCEMVIEVCAPIFVFREWHRHRTQSFNEFSARYSKMEDLHYVPTANRFLPKASENKQEASEGEGAGMPLSVAAEWQAEVSSEQEELYRAYDQMLGEGVPREVARINTPVSRYSKMRAKANLRNWLGFLKLRLAPNAQYEIRMYARAVSDLVRTLWPRTYELFEEHTLGAVTVSKSEARELYEHLNSAMWWVNSSVQPPRDQCEAVNAIKSRIVSKLGDDL